MCPCVARHTCVCLNVCLGLILALKRTPSLSLWAPACNLSRWMDGWMILSRPVSNKERNQKVTSLYTLNHSKNPDVTNNILRINLLGCQVKFHIFPWVLGEN